MINIKFLLKNGRFIRKIRQTFHAEIEIWEYKNKKYVVKKIGSRYNYLTNKEIIALAKKINYYYSHLKKCKIPVPSEFDTEIIAFAKNNLVINVSSYCGNPIREIIERANLNIWKDIIRKILKIIYKVFSSSENIRENKRKN